MSRPDYIYRLGIHLTTNSPFHRRLGFAWDRIQQDHPDKAFRLLAKVLRITDSQVWYPSCPSPSGKWSLFLRRQGLLLEVELPAKQGMKPGRTAKRFNRAAKAEGLFVQP